jgi:hypothetical protein
MHLLAIFGIALLLFEPKSFRNLRSARAADFDVERTNVVDDLRINYPHFSFATRE